MKIRLHSFHVSQNVNLILDFLEVNSYSKPFIAIISFNKCVTDKGDFSPLGIIADSICQIMQMIFSELKV